MRRAVMGLGLVVALGLGALWLTGGFDVLQGWMERMTRAAQDRLAAAVRALRSGEPGALAGFLAVSFVYGVLHAVGPGHGKFLVGGYGVARRVPVVPLAGIALVASLAQAAVAVVLVYAAVAVLGWTREAVVGTAEEVMAPVSHALIAGLGAWLVWRGWRGVRRERHGHDHDHGHEHGHVHGPDCGHAHGPTLDEVSRLTGWRDAVALVAGVAMRPCSGALFLLILTWQIGVGAAGIAGAFAMGLGTAAVTVTVALMAVWAREGALANLSGGRLARALPLVELSVGALILLVALGLLRQSL
ncbi:nickel/cobalt transporter [Tabrizicola sp. BL-A-41-H6]|uniref:nickel/cobalt transporter n=1 Tax=Tabrizicola sp. BL-A-41-H6 TaxID=3421107 RepID=UPI003D668DCC